MGTHRVTFLIGPDGRIARIWLAVKPDEHAQEVLAAIVTARRDMEKSKHALSD